MKKTFLFLLFLQLNYSLFGQFSAPIFIAPEIHKPFALALGDVNNDGFIDIIATAVGNDKIFWMKNLNGSGNFSLPIFLDAEVSEPRALMATDLNDDGNLDLLVASSGSNQLFWFDNVDGLGGFQQKIIDNNLEDPWSIYAADLDGDSDLDIISSSFEGNKMVWYEQYGNDSFSEAIILSDDIIFGRQMSAADLDNDGDEDIVGVSHTPGLGVVWFENMDGLGNFGSKNEIPGPYASAHSVCAQDLDGDGDIDIIFGSSSGRELWWTENIDGMGTFGSPILIDVSTLANTIQAIDLDGDLDLDILTVDALELIWFENIDGFATFEERNIIDDNANNSVNAVAGDIDNDGDLDIVAIAATGNEISWYENLNGQGVFSSANQITSHGNDVEAIHVSDLDGDGDKDILAGYFFDAKLTWYKNENGMGGFSSKTIISTEHDNVNDLTTGDIDLDGDQDIVAAFWLHDKVARYENLNGMGAFSDQLFFCNVESPRSTILVDINNDIYPDLIFSGEGSIYVSLNDQNGSFYNPTVIHSEGNPSYTCRINVADIDGDGDLDIIAGYYLGETKLIWFENLYGNGSFSGEKIIDQFAARYVVPGDLDNDGDQDIIAGTYSYSVWYKNLDGNGNFGPPIELTSPSFASPEDFSVVDVDLDGKQDIIFITENDTYWIRNSDGNFDFYKRQIIAKKGGNAIYTSDIDNDGDFDLVAEHGEYLVWYKNCFIVDDVYLDRWKVSLSPNPTKGKAALNFDLSLNQDWQVEVYNSFGNLVQSFNAPEGGSSQGLVYFYNLDTGTYLVVLRVDNRVHTQTLVVFNN